MALSLQWLGFASWPRNLAKKKKKKTMLICVGIIQLSEKTYGASFSRPKKLLNIGASMSENVKSER